MEKIEEQLKNLSVIKMTEGERNRLRAGVISHVMDKSQVFHFSMRSPWSLRYAPLFTKITAAVLVCVLVGGGTLTFASEKSLPGDLLYPIKISVKENIIEGSLIHTPEDILNWQQKRLTRRIDEVKQLKKKGAISKKQAQVVTTVVKDHVSQIQSAISTLKDEGKSDVVLASTATLIPIVASLDEDKDTTVSPTIDNETISQNATTKEEDVTAENTEKMVPADSAMTKMMVLPEPAAMENTTTMQKKLTTEDETTTSVEKKDDTDATASLEAEIKLELKKIEADVKAVADGTTEKEASAEPVSTEINTKETPIKEPETKDTLPSLVPIKK